MDLNPLTTPNTVLTDAQNATLLTYNGNEMVLQNDEGNAKIEGAYLSKNFVPIGVKSYGNIIYVISYNPGTKQTEIGTFPSPSYIWSDINKYSVTPSSFNKYYNLSGNTSLVKNGDKLLITYLDNNNLPLSNEYLSNFRFQGKDLNNNNVVNKRFIYLDLCEIVKNNTTPVDLVYGNNFSNTESKYWFSTLNITDITRDTFDTSSYPCQVITNKKSGNLSIIAKYEPIDNYFCNQYPNITKTGGGYIITFNSNLNVWWNSDNTIPYTYCKYYKIKYSLIPKVGTNSASSQTYYIPTNNVINEEVINPVINSGTIELVSQTLDSNIYKYYYSFNIGNLQLSNLGYYLQYSIIPCSQFEENKDLEIHGFIDISKSATSWALSPEWIADSSDVNNHCEIILSSYTKFSTANIIKRFGRKNGQLIPLDWDDNDITGTSNKQAAYYNINLTQEELNIYDLTYDCYNKTQNRQFFTVDSESYAIYYGTSTRIESGNYNTEYIICKWANAACVESISALAYNSIFLTSWVDSHNSYLHYGLDSNQIKSYTDVPDYIEFRVWGWQNQTGDYKDVNIDGMSGPYAYSRNTHNFPIGYYYLTNFSHRAYGGYIYTTFRPTIQYYEQYARKVHITFTQINNGVFALNATVTDYNDRVAELKSSFTLAIDYHKINGITNKMVFIINPEDINSSTGKLKSNLLKFQHAGSITDGSYTNLTKVTFTAFPTIYTPDWTNAVGGWNKTLPICDVNYDYYFYDDKDANGNTLTN